MLESKPFIKLTQSTTNMNLRYANRPRGNLKRTHREFNHRCRKELFQALLRSIFFPHKK